MSDITTLSETTRTSRGKVRCNLCGRRIDKGERYDETTNVYDGRVYRWRDCSHCIAFRTLTTLGDYLYEVASWSGDGYGPDSVAEFEPGTRFECVLKAQWERGWRNYGGQPARLRRPERGTVWHNRLRPDDDCPLVPIPGEEAETDE